MYRGGESARTSSETATDLAGLAAFIVLKWAATGPRSTTLALSGGACGSTESTALRVQQFCAQLPPAVMPVMGQSGAMPVIAMGQPGTQAGAIPAAQLRLERTGCAARRATTRSTADLSRCFIRSPSTLETLLRNICDPNYITFVNVVPGSVFNAKITSPPSAPRSAPACLPCASPGWSHSAWPAQIRGRG